MFVMHIRTGLVNSITNPDVLKSLENDDNYIISEDAPKEDDSKSEDAPKEVKRTRSRKTKEG